MLAGQNNSNESPEEEKTKSTWNDLPFFMDDIYFVAGLNNSGIFMSRWNQELGSSYGFHAGVEMYSPVMPLIFLNYGIHFSSRSFVHRPESIEFNVNYLDFPLYASFELPELRSIDFRFFLGTQVSFRLSASESSAYSQPIEEANFQYDIRRFRRTEFGMTYGLSGEYKNFFGRFRGYVAAINLDTAEQGSMYSFQIELGYFLFRNLRKWD